MAGRSTKAKVATVLALAVILILPSCKTKKDDDAKVDDDSDASFADEGTDTSSAESDAQLLTSSLIASAPNGTLGLASVALSGSELGTRDLGDGARAIYLPRGCLTVAHDEAAKTVVYTFSRCLGPAGLRAVTGTVTARYSKELDKLHLDLTADDLQVNEATVDWAATADVVATEVDRTMHWKAQLSGTSARGHAFSRTGEHTVTWRLGEPCFSLSGFSVGEIKKRGGAEGREIRTEISDFRRCRRGCPEDGGKITITNVAKSKRIELRYDGTNRGTLVGPNGKVTSVPLLCRA